jgi:hypothetical protein
MTCTSCSGTEPIIDDSIPNISLQVFAYLLT